jgi:hypothetical protein
MTKKIKQITERSKCCDARVKVVGRTTLHYECTKCGEACDIFFTNRRTWTINPKTRVVPNTKKSANRQKENRIKDEE